MKTYSVSIPIGIGDLLYIKAMFDPVKHEYSSINLNLKTSITEDFKKDPNNNVFVQKLCELLFDSEPYHLNMEQAPFRNLQQISGDCRIKLQKPELQNILCKGQSLNLERPYIVINTKSRYLNQNDLNEKIEEFWNVLNMLSDKYKIVILGERELELNDEYKHHNKNGNIIFSLYNDIMSNITNQDSILDLTVPALGITSPDLQKLQQDCLIMNEAKCVIQFGVGGSFCIASAVANLIAYRTDDEFSIEQVFDKHTYKNAIVTKDWQTFIKSVKEYL